MLTYILSHIDSTNSVDHASSGHNSVNVLQTAKQNFALYVTSNQFSIHNVTGDCNYNAVMYQLESNGVVTTTVENLRQMVATYLEENADIYMPFVVSPIAS